ncbi:MAG: hypothetical protein IH596_13735 [Bacteroidales bacterium]|nr:hypothetical protein [Bacteroidales bacterium]
MKKLSLLTQVLFGTTMPGYSLIIHVPTDYSTILAAILAATDGDTVLVAKGTYKELLTFEGRDIVVASEFLTSGDSLCIDETILHPS